MIGNASSLRDALFSRTDPFVAAVDRVHRRITGAGQARALVQYQRDPIGFAVDVLAIPERTLRWSLNPGYENHTWDGTPDPIARMLEELAAWNNVGLESGTGTGKSFGLALAILWFTGSFEGARTFTFAPTEEQLRLYSWTELRKLWPRFQARFPAAVLTDLRLQMIAGSDEWGAWGRSVQIRAGEDVSSRAAGMHAPHQLLIYEEGQGIDPSVYAAGENTSTGPHNLRCGVGNPDHEHDGLHQLCTAPDVEHVIVSALDHPNVVCNDPEIVPGAVSRISIERRRARYGEDSPIFKSRVRGIARSESSEALIKMEWIRRAVARWKDPAERARLAYGGFPARGVDVSNSENGDPAAIARGIGALCTEVDSFACPRADLLGVRIALEMALEKISPEHVAVDAGGVGASTVNKLKELGRYVQALHSGGKARPSIDEDLLREKGKAVAIEELFQNLRGQMWWQLRMDLYHDRLALPDDAELHRELIALEWQLHNGVIHVESKRNPLPNSKQRRSLLERLGRSPNKGDALVHWNFVRYRRLEEEEQPQASAWDPEILEHEASENRRVRSKPSVRPAGLNPITVEHVP